MSLKTAWSRRHILAWASKDVGICWGASSEEGGESHERCQKICWNYLVASRCWNLGFWFRYCLKEDVQYWKPGLRFGHFAPQDCTHVPIATNLELFFNWKGHFWTLAECLLLLFRLTKCPAGFFKLRLTKSWSKIRSHNLRSFRSQVLEAQVLIFSTLECVLCERRQRVFGLVFDWVTFVSFVIRFICSFPTVCVWAVKV